MVVNPYRRSLAGWLSAAQMGTVMVLVWAALRLFPLTRVLRWCGERVTDLGKGLRDAPPTRNDPPVVGAPLVGTLPAVDASKGRDKPYPYRAGDHDPEYAGRMAWAAQAVGRRLFGSGPCLVQALALNWFYSRKGIPGRLCIGVAKEAGGRLAAHAWLESGDQVVAGGPEELLAGFVRLPALTQEGQ